MSPSSTCSSVVAEAVAEAVAVAVWLSSAQMERPRQRPCDGHCSASNQAAARCIRSVRERWRRTSPRFSDASLGRLGMQN
eukprot:CAMPEP_0119525936 /NCGR_PEP_ID=MMETSP1344-20130328/40631_1 /TAXON_ID=236787 /ORGANISM="Florenciella parvula, Strain CCMP2471" /LENGTH=79 /DNA_ID=CAMNT_0007564807 /DNA_START=35 /DNA_END=271 /DNA_ORIENTATION=+